MSNKLSGVVTIVLIVAASWGGLSFPGIVSSSMDMPSRIQPGLQPSVQAQETRSIDASLEAVSWVAFAFRVTPDLEPEDIEIEVTYIWDENPGARDRTQRWFSTYYGPAVLGENPYPRSGYMVDRSSWHEDGVLEVEARAAGEGVQLAEPYPMYDDMCCSGTRTTLTFAMHQHDNPFDPDRLPQDDPTLHLVLAAGGPVLQVEVEARWTNTTLNWTAGEFEDIFTYFRGDYESPLYARADVTPGWNPYMHSGAVLDVEIVRDDRPVLFWYAHRPDAWTGTSFDAGWERPDGSTVARPFFPIEATDQAGIWTYWLEGGRGNSADKPVLYGTVFEWAEVP